MMFPRRMLNFENIKRLSKSDKFDCLSFAGIRSFVLGLEV